MLDLRISSAPHLKMHNEIDSSQLSYDKLAQYGECAASDMMPQPMALDLYRQYYYYLMQEPAFASRAAVAVAETYAKLLSQEKFNSKHSKSPQGDKLDTGQQYESKRAPSPDFIISKSKTELRSADTTNGNLPFDRKRISRPLTGKHVRHGTGASPSTLVSLRNMIQQRQKLKENGKFDGHSRFGKGKANKRIKRK